MSMEQVATEEVCVRARNIGGISDTEVAFEPGVTILTGRNATNRTSLLQAIMLALGSERASLKGDADSGEVTLEIGNDTYTRTLSRHNGSISLGGDPYLDDPELADLFAFLLEGNEARRAVARGEDLRELIMRPIDTEAIQAAIERLETERREVDQHLEEIEREEGRLVELEQRRSELEDKIEAKRGELETVEETLDSLDESVEETLEEKDAFEAKLDQLREKRSEREGGRHKIEREEASIESLTDERTEIEAQLEDFQNEPSGDVTHIETEIERLRERRRNLNTVVGELQNVVQFNEQMLEDDRTEYRNALGQHDDEDGAVTDQLVESKTACWTCGSEVEKDQIESTLDQLRELRKEKFETIQQTERRLDELKDERQSIERNRKERSDLETRLDRIDDELETRRERVEELREDHLEHEAELETLEAEAESFESEDFSDVLDKHKEANQLEFELGQLRSDLESVEADIESVEATLDEREDLEAEREDIKAELTDLRTKIDQVEQQAVEEFNTHMETVLDLLEYENLERIWIERVERKVREGRRKVKQSRFEVQLVRKSAQGAAYEDTLDHLSESEREVTGLVFALAGYLVHEVYETLPFIVLDSLEAIDSNRIASLVEYFSNYADYSVVALLPEDEAALAETHQRVSEI